MIIPAEDQTGGNMKQTIVIVLTILPFLYWVRGETYGAGTDSTGQARNLLGSSVSQIAGTGDERATHFVWVDDIDGNPEVYYYRQGHNTKNDSPITRLSRDPFGVTRPVVTVEGNNVYAAWLTEGQGVSFSSSYDWGNTWSTPKTVITPARYRIGDPGISSVTLAANKDKIVLLGPTGIAVSSDAGRTWKKQAKDFSSQPGFHQVGLGLDSKGIIHLVYTSIAPRERHVIYQKRAFDEDRWSAEHDIGKADGDPMLAVDTNDGLHLVYLRIGDTQFRNVVYRRSLDGGLTWDAELLISRKADFSTSIPQIAVSGKGDVGIAWGYNPYAREAKMLFAHIRDGKLVFTDKPIGSAEQSSLFSGPNQFYISWGQELFQSNDSGKSWVKMTIPEQSYEFQDVEIYTLSLDGKILRNLTKNNGNDSDPNVSPKTGEIAFVSELPGKSGSRTISRVCILQKGQIRYISGFEPFTGEGGSGFTEFSPRWSADGSGLAFWISSSDPWLPTGLFVYDFKEGQLKHLCGPDFPSVYFTEGESYRPVFEWLADSRKIMVAKLLKGPEYKQVAVLVDAETGKESPLDDAQFKTEKTSNSAPPQAFISNKTGDYAIYILEDVKAGVKV